MSNIISDSLNKKMSRKEFLQMSGALLLAVIGVQNLIAIFQKHVIQNTSSVSLLKQEQQSSNGFGSRGFGQ